MKKHPAKNTLSSYFILVVIILSICTPACWPVSTGVSPIPFTQPFAKMDASLGRERYITVSKKLKFIYRETYFVDPSANKLTYSIYNQQHITMLGVSPTGSALVSGSPLLIRGKGDNRYTLDLTSTSLTAGSIYVLEVSNKKQEKQYLRFKIY